MATVWPSANYESRYGATYEEFSLINHLVSNDPPLCMEYNRPLTLRATSDGRAIHHPVFGWFINHGLQAGTKSSF